MSVLADLILFQRKSFSRSGSRDFFGSPKRSTKVHRILCTIIREIYDIIYDNTTIEWLHCMEILIAKRNRLYAGSVERDCMKLFLFDIVEKNSSFSRLELDKFFVTLLVCRDDLKYFSDVWKQIALSDCIEKEQAFLKELESKFHSIGKLC